MSAVFSSQAFKDCMKAIAQRVLTDIDSIVVAALSFAVSQELKLDIQRFALAVLLSPKLGMYQGDVPIQHVMYIVKKHCFNLPPGIENNPADMDKIEKAVQEALTQHRSTCKKLFASVKVSSFVDGTKCCITNALCSRIALMRDVYLQNSGQSFWTNLDKALTTMRDVANRSDKVRDDLFEGLITHNKELHGAVDIVYQTSNDVQQEVDDLIDTSSANIASTRANLSSTTPPAAESKEGEGEPEEG
ncbi:hypothetical protein B0H19DRAFT_1264220 [Mycena capillaripes]|nr:hypothetical protein B0H19DRAFT_1264220 [Mycena capillaripes]